MTASDDSIRAELDAVREKTDTRFEQLATMIERLDARFDRLELRFERVALRFDKVENRLERLDNDVTMIARKLFEDDGDGGRMTASVTTTARRIARRHNQLAARRTPAGSSPSAPSGEGGEWYGAGARPDVPIVFPVRWGRVTARDVQEWLDDRSEAL
jgi:hypothetical protein